MGLKTAFQHAPQGIRIPYSADGESGRTNSGFLDLRGRPDRVAEIPEAQASPALRTILVELAAVGAPLFSLGCDLGCHTELKAPPRQREVAGGYLHVVAARYANATKLHYRKLADAVTATLAAQAGHHAWAVAFLLQDVDMLLDAGARAQCPSLTLSFFAAAEHLADAVSSREALLVAMAAPLRDFQHPSSDIC